jgi:hypothetical protein
MFPRDTFDGFIFPTQGGQMVQQPTRITRIEHRVVRMVNPWIALHDGTVFDAKSLADWELCIPQYGCQCKAFYRAWKAENAPDFSSPEAFFAWGVALHNAVNAKLGKPQITLDEAYSIWRKDDGMEHKENTAERS